MSNRVILGAFAGTHVFRVSRPGFDVLNDSLPPNAIAFDSRWSESANVFMEGTFSASANNSSNTVNYGTTLPSVPIVIIRLKDPERSRTIAYVNQRNPIVIGSDNNWANPMLDVRRDHFSLKYTGGWPHYEFLGLVPWTVRYTVLSNVYG